ncbi:MAG: hypothetical protein ACE5K4_10095 [Candidatus Hydrothermarchaeota archaeon]
MKSQRNILISTVGISLLSNIEKLPQDNLLKIEKVRGNWIGLSKRLLEESAEDKVNKIWREKKYIKKIYDNPDLSEKEKLKMVFIDLSETYLKK